MNFSLEVKVMFVIERQQEILNLLKMQKSVKVTELSKKFYIGEATIRRDLDKLEKKGLLKRTYGGAILLEGLDSEIPLSVREIDQKNAKDIIGNRAVQLVEDGNIIIMDSSSTVLKMAPYLKDRKQLTIITNGAKTAVELGEMFHFKIHCTGGTLRENSLSYIGEHARRCIDSMFADTLFFSCRAISTEKGLTDICEEEAELRKLMIKNCKKIVLLCDSTKFDNVAFCKIEDFDKIHYIVTDKCPSAQWENFFMEKNVTLLY